MADRDRGTDPEPKDVERADAMADDDADRDPDETTRREASELELEDAQISEAGTRVTAADPDGDAPG